MFAIPAVIHAKEASPGTQQVAATMNMNGCNIIGNEGGVTRHVAIVLLEIKNNVIPLRLTVYNTTIYT